MNLKLVSLVALCGAFVVACGDSGSDTPAGGGSEGGGSEGGSPNVGGGGVGGEGNSLNVGGGGEGGEGAGTPGCFDESAANTGGLIPTMSAVGLDVCTPAQIDAYYAACLTMESTQETCDAFYEPAAGNGICGGCIYGFDDLSAEDPMLTGNLPPLVQGEVYVFAQTLACEAAVQNLPQCASPLSNLVYCAQSACEQTCDLMSGEFDECVNYAATEGICGQTLEIPAECEPILTATEASPQCTGTDFEDLLDNMANYFCGPPAP